MAEAVLGLGGNLGARRALLRGALALLAGATRVLACSRLYETVALGPIQPDFLNAAVRVQWDGDVLSLLARVQGIEAQLGRERGVHWGPRTLDIDILYWSEGPVCEAGLEVPHRELAARSFALAPLLDVSPELASEWASRLALLGGAPALAVPSWPVCPPSAAYVDTASPWLTDVGELASVLAEMIAQRGGPQEAASHTRVLEGPRELVDVEGCCWLATRIIEALEDGFMVSRAAILECKGERMRGVLIGSPGGCAIRLPVPRVCLERRGEQEQRAILTSTAPDRGFDFKESITM